MFTKRRGRTIGYVEVTRRCKVASTPCILELEAGDLDAFTENAKDWIQDQFRRKRKSLHNQKKKRGPRIVVKIHGHILSNPLVTPRSIARAGASGMIQRASAHARSLRSQGRGRGDLSLSCASPPRRR